MRLLKQTIVFTLLATLVLSFGFASNVQDSEKRVRTKDNHPAFVTPEHYDVGRTEDFTLVLTDSWGDGWDGANMDVFQNGTLLLDDITIDDGSEAVFTFAVDNGDLIETVYTSGSYESEHSYAFYDQNGNFIVGDGPSPGAGVSFTVEISYDIPGCMNVDACNYNPDATIDDGSCCITNCLTVNLMDSLGDGWNGNVLTIGENVYELPSGSSLLIDDCLDDGTYVVTCGGGSYQSEVSWEILDGAGAVLLSGGAPFEGVLLLGESTDILGCTDSTAVNYDPDATVDDGSCVYEGDECLYALDGGVVNGAPTYGATTEAYDVDWYSFVVDADYDNVIVSLCGSGYDTKLEVWGACEDADYLGYNDDAPCGNFNSQVDLTNIVAGTYYAKVYGYGSSFGDYVLTLTAFNNPTSPTLTATGIGSGVSLEWEGVVVDEPAATQMPTINPVNKALDVKPYDTFTADLTVYNSRALYALTVGGGSWDSEISWEITDTGANILYSGGAGVFDIDLADGSYVFNGYDSYGDGWNGGTALLVDENGGYQFFYGLLDGDFFTETFDLPTSDIWGCTDPAATNYNPDATMDDGSCDYTVPSNDECTSPEFVEGPYPTTVTGSNLGATVDCEGLLDWNAVWYEIDLPYAANNVTVTLCGNDAAISNAGIILMDDCACDDYFVASYSWTEEGCIELSFAEIAGPGTILYPAYIEPQQNFTVTVDVEEVYVPTFNIYKDGDSLDVGVDGNSYVDSDVVLGTEYCYTVEQVLPGGDLSGMSNEACASPLEGATGTSCEDAIPAVLGQNDAELMPLWYSYTAQTDCELEITSQNATGDAAWDTYLYVYGSCQTDGDGNLIDLIGSNDDCCGYWGPSTVSIIVAAGDEVKIFWDDAWDSQPFTFFVNESAIPTCEDDEFEDDDNKDIAVNHGAEGTFTYALCMYDNEGGIMQPSGVAAVDWSVVTVEPYHILTAATHGTGDPGNDIDLFFEDYAGDGVCAWGGGDDLAGSGNMDCEEEASWINETLEPVNVYVGVIYYAGEDPIPYELTISLVAPECPDAPQNVVAELSGDQTSIGVTWDAPLVMPGTALAENRKEQRMSLEQADNQPTRAKLHSTKQTARPTATTKGPRYTADLTIHEIRAMYALTVGGGSWDSEISWNITDTGANELYSGAAGVFDVDLADGTYIFNGFDAYGDGWNGGTATLVDADGAVQFTAGLEDGESFSLEFTVPNAEVYGCTDPEAINYNPDATVDDGSCYYAGDTCLEPLTATYGENAADGVGPQYFSYVATMDALLTVTSQNATGDAVWDTYLGVLGSCDVDEDGYYLDVLGANDDCCDYWGPSTVTTQVTTGQEVIIYWTGAYSPGPFTFWVTEEEMDCVDDDFEDNDSSSSPAAITEGTYELQLCAIDPDWFEITVDNGFELHLTVTDHSETGMVDVGIWVFELDDTYTQVYSPNENVHNVVWANNSDHPMVADFAVGDFWDGVPETAYTLTVALVPFDQVTYTVYRSDNGAEEQIQASGLLNMEYTDTAISQGNQYCYTVTANLPEYESIHSCNDACVTIVEPPAAPTNVQAEGTWFEDYASIVWSWDYEGYVEPARADQQAINLQDILDGTYQNTTRDVVGFILAFEFGGTVYEFATEYLSILIYGFADGDYVCGWVYAVDDNGVLSLPSDTACAEAGGETGCEVVADNLEGWNLISLAVGVEDASVSALYPGSIEGTCYGYPYGEPVNTLVNGDGYWLRFTAAGTNTFAGDCTDDVAVSLAEGWNLIGSVSASAGLADPSGVIIEGTLYDYPYGEPATSVEPGKGYWVRASAAGDVTVSTSALGGLARISEPEANVLTINGMKLYFGMDMNEKDALSFSMPPKPPAGAFDVRFAGDMRAIETSGMIQTQGTDNLSIEWNVTKEAGDHMFWTITTTDGQVIEMNGFGSVELSGNINSIMLGKTREIPEQFMLAQNFPNPFNPVTSIDYALPEEGFVTISVYNIMGQKVTELVNSVKQGGYHTVVWNGTNSLGEPVSTGVYMYAIEAEGFTAVKKMILMK